jgi:hypothetical protein
MDPKPTRKPEQKRKTGPARPLTEDEAKQVKGGASDILSKLGKIKGESGE